MKGRNDDNEDLLAETKFHDEQYFVCDSNDISPYG